LSENGSSPPFRHYPRLQSPRCADKLAPFISTCKTRLQSRFALFHRRFSTNTTSTWDKAQPFRLIGHNGEINTITANKSWAFAREKASGLKDGEVLTHEGMSDSGSFNEMVEALAYRSGLPSLAAILAIMMPPAIRILLYEFWGRAMEPWDGPALVVFADGERSRVSTATAFALSLTRTQDHFFLCSEAGALRSPKQRFCRKARLPLAAA
jgi:glutamate synthase domain-containing protein 1